jgi:hypothetical protein
MQQLSRWKWVLRPLRFVVSGGLLIYLVWHADPAAIWEAWQQTNLWLLGLAILLQFVGVAVSAQKWNIILAIRNQSQPYLWTLKMYLVGQFANNFLPTSVGGDAVRVLQLGRRIGSYSQSSASVFIDRLTGFFALSLLACAALLLTYSGLPGTAMNTTPALTILAAVFTLAAIVAIFGSFSAPRILQLIGPQRLPGFLRKPLEKITAALAAYSPQGWIFFQVMSFSLCFHGIWVLVHLVCGMALGIEAPILVYLLMVPLTDMVGLAPIFVNNLGARDLVFTLYLGQVGVPAATAIALAFMIFSVRLLVSLLGGLILLLSGSEFRVADPRRAPLEPGKEAARVQEG